VCSSDLDSLGSPKRYQYEDINSISPSSLRYIKVASDIKNIFKDKINFNNARIIEIGCGYGGQCFVLNQLFNIEHYYIVDIPEAQKLANKYLQKLNIKNYTIVPIENLSNITDEYDLVISNYAYSELDKNFQDYYYDHIIKKSKHGYLTFNFISSLFNIDSYSKEEIIDKFNQYQPVSLLNEEPKTHKDNFIIYF
jgi:putative sugar O-methyltransferase